MERTIENVIDDLIFQIKEYGSKKPTLHVYRNVYQSLINHCNRKGYEVYDNQIPNEFLSKAVECYENGLHCYEYHRFIKRAIRLLDTFIQTGKPDFSHSKEILDISIHLITYFRFENKFQGLYVLLS